MHRIKAPFIVYAGLFLSVLLFESPAHAAGMIYSGVNGGGAPAMLSLGTKGIAFLIIWIIEAIVFHQYLKISIPKAVLGSLVLNLFSSFCGIMLSLVAFSLPSITYLALGGFIFLTYRIYYHMENVPKNYGSILLLTIGIGAFASYQIAKVVPPVHPMTAWMLFIVPLLTGYGISLGLEALISGRLLGVKNSWGGLIRANLISYIACILMIPFYPGNLYDGAERHLEDVLSEKVINGAEAGEMVTKLRHFAASNFYILGLSKDSTPPDKYWAGLEIDTLAKAYSKENENLPDPAVGHAIVENALSYPLLFEESEEDLTWAKSYFGYWVDAVEAQSKDDSTSNITTPLEWTIWYQTSDVPDKFAELPEPNTLIEMMSDYGDGPQARPH